MIHDRIGLLIVSIAATLLAGCATHRHTDLERVIDSVVPPLMAHHRIPGMAVGVMRGDDSVVRCFGVASRESGTPVDGNTLFEIGSITKTFTTLLGAHAVGEAAFDLTDEAGVLYPALAGSPLGRATMLQLATYNAGGLPLQFPPDVTTTTLLEYLINWNPPFAPGSQRLYSNPSIGVFAMIAAHAAGRNFPEMMTDTILAPLDLRSTYLTVPPSENHRYATGYDQSDRPVRVNPGVLDAETYGIKSTITDMISYMRAQMPPDQHTPLTRAIALTHRGWYSVGPMTQALGWEKYTYPVTLGDLLAGNSGQIILHPNPVHTPHEHGEDALLNKTGSTTGFGAYIAFVPARKIGVVVLANRNYPIADRITLTHTILRALDPDLDPAMHTTVSFR